MSAADVRALHRQRLARENRENATRGASGPVSGPTVARALAAPLDLFTAAAVPGGPALSGAGCSSNAGGGSEPPLPPYDPTNPMAYVGPQRRCGLAETFGMTHLPNVTIVEPDGSHTPPTTGSAKP